MKLEVLNLEITARYHESLYVMKWVFEKLKKLKNVEIDFSCSGLEDGRAGEGCFVVALATNNPDLRVLHLENYPSLSDETLDLLANSCPGLEEFRYSYRRFNVDITDRGIERLVVAAKNLKHLHLDLGRAPRVTKDLVKRLREEYQDLITLKINRSRVLPVPNQIWAHLLHD